MTCTSRSLYELPNTTGSRKLPRFKVKLRLVKRVYRLPFALPELKQEQAQTRSPAHVRLPTGVHRLVLGKRNIVKTVKPTTSILRVLSVRFPQGRVSCVLRALHYQLLGLLRGLGGTAQASSL